MNSRFQHCGRAVLACLAMLGFGQFVGAVEALESWSDVRINQVAQAEPVLIYRNEQGELYTRASDLAGWHLPFPGNSPVINRRGQELVRIAARPGLDVVYAADTRRLDLKVDPWLLPVANSSIAQPAQKELVAGDLALFGNYQLHADHGQQLSLAGDFEVGASRGRTSLATEWLATQFTGGLRRLDTSLRIDMPERKSYLAIGDAVGVAGIGGRGWRFAGVQWSSDLDMAPGIPTFALPTAQGVATVPSTVDLYVNRALVGSREVNAGPFAISDIPVPTGAGTVVMRVHDALGREQVIEQQFLATPLLLPTGMSTQAAEAGWLRYGYGTDNFDYGAPFAAVSMRSGVSNSITLEGQLEIQGEQQAARFAGSTRLGDHLIASLGTAFSSHDSGTGHAVDLLLDWQSPFVSIAAQARLLDHKFTDLSTPDGTGALREWSAQLSPRLPMSGSAGIVFTQRTGRTAASDVSVATLFVSFARVAGGSLSLQLSHVSSITQNDARVGLSFVKSLGAGRSTSANLSQGTHGVQADWQLGSSVPRDTGWGWQFGTRSGTSTLYAGRLESHTRYGLGDFEAGYGRGNTNLSASWNGGWVLAAGDISATQPLNQAIAIIDTPGIAGARIFHDGQDLGRTDANGRLIDTRLRAYETNRLRVDTSDVPIGAWIDQENMSVSPYTRGVVHLRFATQATSHLLTLRLPDGGYVPAGAHVETSGHTYPVGEEGKVSLPLEAGQKSLRVGWGRRACEVPLPATLDTRIPDLVCRSVAR